MPLMDIGGGVGVGRFFGCFYRVGSKSPEQDHGPTGFVWRTSGLQVYMAKRVIQERLVGTYNALSFSTH